MKLLAVDLAARASGWILLDVGEQPYRVVAHGIVVVKGVWGPLAWEETQKAWVNVLGTCTDQFHYRRPLIPLDCIAYEVPGWAGQSGDSKSGHGTSRNTRRMLDQAEALFGAIAVGYSRRIMRLDQGDMKEAIAGKRRADKADISVALRLRAESGEWHMPEGEDGTWSDHELDALAIGLYAAALLMQEAMA